VNLLQQEHLKLTLVTVRLAQANKVII